MSRDKEKDSPVLRQRRLACENIRFDVFLDEVQGSDGEIIHDYLVVAPKTRTGDLITGVAVLPVVDGKLGLLHIFRHPVQRCLWEVPRGFVDPDESERRSALRELEEETGLVCEDSGLEAFGVLAPEPGILAARVALFVARRCHARSPFNAMEFGHKEFRLFAREEISALLDAGEIQDPCTMILCARYQEIR